MLSINWIGETMTDENTSDVFQEEYAAIYDWLYIAGGKDYEIECDFIEGVFKEFAEEKPKKLLTLACGTGTHEIILADRGYSVVGTDMAPAMIALAKQKVKDHDVEFHVQRMEKNRSWKEIRRNIVFVIFN